MRNSNQCKQCLAGTLVDGEDGQRCCPACGRTFAAPAAASTASPAPSNDAATSAALKPRKRAPRKPSLQAPVKKRTPRRNSK